MGHRGVVVVGRREWLGVARGLRPGLRQKGTPGRSAAKVGGPVRRPRASATPPRDGTVTVRSARLASNQRALSMSVCVPESWITLMSTEYVSASRRDARSILGGARLVEHKKGRRQ